MANLINYNFDMGTDEGRAGFEELCKSLKGKGLKPWEQHIDKSFGYCAHPSFETGEVALELEFLFDNQWNSDTHRLFDWVVTHQYGKKTDTGYYLELTPEEAAARAETVKCGYCQTHYGTHHKNHHRDLLNGLCVACVGGEHLELDDVKKGAVRLYPIAGFMPNGWQHLTQAEFDTYLPIYDAAQERARLARIEKARKREREKMEETYLSAKGEYQGKLWLWDKGYELDNVIYYSHKKQFCFGWRTPLTADEEMHLLDEVLVNAPFDFDLKAEH